MSTPYRIRNWDEYFEIAQSRNAPKSVSWVAVPNKHDGKSFLRLMRHPDGVALYGAWCLIVQVASKCPKRGLLADSDGALSAEDIAIKTSCPIEAITHALQVCSGIDIRWIDGGPQNALSIRPLIDHHETTILQTDRQTGQTGQTGQDRTDIVCSEPETAPAHEPPALLVFACAGKVKQWHLTQADVDELKAAFPGLDILAQCRKALAWTQANPTKQKTAKGMKSFLFRWVERSQNSGGDYPRSNNLHLTMQPGQKATD